MLRVAILLTVHNRKDKTLVCLDNCRREIDAMKDTNEYSFSIFLNDDGSSDGTSEYVRESFPDVRILRSDGSLFWNQGMRLAWAEAAKEDFDFYLWLNDDTLLRAGALQTLMENSKFLGHRAIVVGTTEDATGQLTYGGRTRSNKIVTPDPVIPVPCYMFNGNIVLVPKTVFKVLGNLDSGYRHSFGDYDYGVRAVRADVTRVVAPGVVGECGRNPGLPKWRDPAVPLKKRYAALLGPKGRPPKEQFLFDCRIWNVFYAIGHMISIHLKVLFPFDRRQG